MDRKTNILLIGMPGAGKSTIGRIISKKTGHALVDTDRLIEAQTGLKLQSVIEEKGLDHFLALEEDILSGLDLRYHIISPGGSSIYSEKAMLQLCSISIVVYLKSSIERLIRNIRNMETRGIVFKPGQDFSGLYEERCPLYEKYADITIDTDSSYPEEMADTIIAQIPSYCPSWRSMHR